MKSSTQLLKELHLFLTTGKEDGCYPLDLPRGPNDVSRVWRESIHDFYRRIGEAYFVELVESDAVHLDESFVRSYIVPKAAV